MPNNGYAQVFIPNNIDTSQARFKVKAKNGVFFALNPVNFKIESRDLVLNFDSPIKENCGEDSLIFSFNIEKEDDFNKNFNLQLISLPANVEVEFSKSEYTPDDTRGNFILSGLSTLDPNDYYFNLEVLINDNIELFPFTLKQRKNSINSPELLLPKNNLQDLTINPTLFWQEDLNSDRSRIQIGREDDFSTLVLDTIITNSQIQISKLDESQIYYWRVQNQNNCSISDFSNVFSFETTTVSCLDSYSDDLPKDIVDATENEYGETIATINISFDSPIIDLNVLVDLNHTWIEDLSLYLEAPSGDRYLLSSALGESTDNYSQTLFDQEAESRIEEGFPPFSGSFMPAQNFSSLYGTSSYGLWKLIVIDQYTADTGYIDEFGLELCLEGIPKVNTDNDSIADIDDNCPDIANEGQADIDENGIGDLCDVFSPQNLSLSKKDTTCIDKENGSLNLNARADFLYEVQINGSNGYRNDLNFTNRGITINNLGPGIYDLCVYVNRFHDFEYCFMTEINSPDELLVEYLLDRSTGLLNLNLSGSYRYNVFLNNKYYEILGNSTIELELTKKINRVQVSTNNPCQGVFEEFINLYEKAQVFPNPVIDNANLILPRGVSVDLYLLSGSGEVIWIKECVNNMDDIIKIPMNKLSRGIYFLQIDNGTHFETIKLLKE